MPNGPFAAMSTILRPPKPPHHLRRRPAPHRHPLHPVIRARHQILRRHAPARHELDRILVREVVELDRRLGPPRVVGHVPFREMFGAFEMRTVGIEESREMYGLLIIAAWMAVLALAPRYSSSAIRSAASRVQRGNRGGESRAGGGHDCRWTDATAAPALTGARYLRTIAP
jgi:hypothetical protein